MYPPAARWFRVALLGFVLSTPSVSAVISLDAIDVAPAWSGHPVRFSLATTADYQYVGFYDPERRMTIGQRRLGFRNWAFTTLPSRVKWDSHNAIVLEVDCQGYVHVSGNMHGSPLVYFRSSQPHDISRFERPGMVGHLERRVTYPRFHKGGDGCLYFEYRHGKSGAGMRIMNRYDAETRTWSRLLSTPLFDGQGKASAYLSDLAVGPDGYFHLVWMWRDTPRGSDNHDLSYARSLDLTHWESVDGKPLRLPLRPGTEHVVVDPIDVGEGLVSISFGVGWDRDDRPVVSYSKYGPDGNSQWFNARWRHDSWEISQTSDWSYRWDLERTGALPWEITATTVRVDQDGRLTQGFDHLGAGRGTWVLDQETLQPTTVLEPSLVDEELKRVELEFPGMEVREPEFDRQGRYFLRWESLPANGDKPRKAPLPPPSMLRVYRRGAEKFDLDDEGHQRQGAQTAESESPNDPLGAPSRGHAAGQSEAPATGESYSMETEATDSLPGEDVLEGDGARIGEIDIRIADVFDESDPTENRRLFRLVNRLHPRTRDWVIRQQLFFEPGDLYSARLLEETERQLRGRDYIYDADIRPIRYRDGVVDVAVLTRDVWTLNGGVRFNRAGGENDIEFNLSDSNFLGLGRDFGISHAKDFERTSSEVRFEDENLFGTHAQMEVKLADNSDGDFYLLHLNRPFYALDVRQARGMTILLDDRVDRAFDRGQVVSEFRHTIDFFEGFWGFSRGLREGSVTRWKVGYNYIDDSFTRTPGQLEGVPLPPDRKLSWPWIQLEFVQDRFVEAKDLNKISRTEDINLGTSAQARLGYSSTALGADENLTIASFGTSTGFKPSENTLLFTSANGGTRYGDGEFRTIVMGASARFFWRNLGRHAFFALAEASYVKDLDPERQLLLGGDTGLRGYPLGYQSGDRRFLVTLEQRFFTKLELLKIGHLGGAVFVDVGRAWFHDGPPGSDLGVLKDVGFGLRLSSSRSSGKSMVHVDVAYPLDGDDSIDSLQFLVTTKESF